MSFLNVIPSCVLQFNKCVFKWLDLLKIRTQTVQFLKWRDSLWWWVSIKNTVDTEDAGSCLFKVIFNSHSTVGCFLWGRTSYADRQIPAFIVLISGHSKVLTLVYLPRSSTGFTRIFLKASLLEDILPCCGPFYICMCLTQCVWD